jgi:predicted nucleotidyltransferase
VDLGRLCVSASLKREYTFSYMRVDMTTIEKLKQTLAGRKEVLRKRFKVEEIGIFGSYVRREQKRKSDLDILVSFSETIDLFMFVELENYLSDILWVKVDLVMKDALKPRLKERILNEAVYL